MEVSVIGISHHTAPVGVREQFALPGELGKRFLRRVRTDDVFTEALVLDTCNRTEVYFVCENDTDPLGYVLDRIAQLKQAERIADTSAFYRHDGPSAVAHIFGVAAALDSQIVGEHQILGQLKDAYRLALQERTARFLMNKLMHWAFRVGKRVQTETEIGRGSASVAQAAVELARQVFSTFADKTAMLVGAGETAELAARTLARCGVTRFVVANRTLARAETLATALLEAGPAASDTATCADTDALEDVSCPAQCGCDRSGRDSGGAGPRRSGDLLDRLSGCRARL